MISQHTGIVNIFGGPGIGKSTFAALLFASLKLRNVSTELVGEYAKDCIRDGRAHVLEDDQVEVFAMQRQRHRRLLNTVDVIVSDSPVMLCSIYAPSHYPMAYHDLVLWAHREIPSINFVLERHVGHYEVEGRIHSETVARGVDRAIVDMLEHHSVPFHLLPVHGRVDSALEILQTTWPQRVLVS